MQNKTCGSQSFVEPIFSNNVWMKWVFLFWLFSHLRSTCALQFQFSSWLFNNQHVLYSFSFPLDCSTCALISSWQVLDISTGRLRTLDETSFFSSAVRCSSILWNIPEHTVADIGTILFLIIHWYGCKTFTWLDFLISLKVLPWYASFHWMTVWHALV